MLSKSDSPPRGADESFIQLLHAAQFSIYVIPVRRAMRRVPSSAGWTWASVDSTFSLQLQLQESKPCRATLRAPTLYCRPPFLRLAESGAAGRIRWTNPGRGRKYQHAPHSGCLTEAKMFFRRGCVHEPTCTARHGACPSKNCMTVFVM